MEDKIQRLVNAANSTNATAKETGMKMLRELGLDNNGNPVSAGPKKEIKPKAEIKKRQPKVESPAKPKAEAKENDLYDCDDLIEKAKERKKKAKIAATKRANEPQKAPATKNKETVEKASVKVEKNIEKRAKKGDVTVAEIEKLITTHEDSVKSLKTLLEKIKSGGKMEKGGSVGESYAEEFRKIKNHSCGCNDKKEQGGDIGGPSKKEMRDYLNMYFDYYSELRTIAVEEDNILTREMLKSLDDRRLEMAYEDAKYEIKADTQFEKGGMMARFFQIDDVVYNTKENTVGIVRLGEERGEVKTDADGNVDVDYLEHYNPYKNAKHKLAKIAPSTKAEIEKRGLGKVHSKHMSTMAKGGNINKKYKYFAISKSDKKIVNGWELTSDIESLKEFAKIDLKDNDLDPKDFNIVSGKNLILQGINPFDKSNWKN